jgi:hypothetical protein
MKSNTSRYSIPLQLGLQLLILIRQNSMQDMVAQREISVDIEILHLISRKIIKCKIIRRMSL